MNRALAELDIKTDYRKASLAEKYKKRERAANATGAKNQPERETDRTKKTERKSKQPSGLPIGKHRVAANKSGSKRRANTTRPKR